MCQQPDEKKLRLLILNDQALFRTSLARLLASETGLEVVRECAACGEALEFLNASPVDVVLLDLRVGGENADDFMSAARNAGYRGRFLIVAETAGAERLANALKVGASGIFRKSEAPDRLILAIRLVTAGALWVDQGIVEVLVGQCADPHNQVTNQKSVGRLEERERKVILGIMEGLTTKKIGSNMDLSEGTVKNILQGLFAKTGVRKRSQLVKLAMEGSLGTAVESAHFPVG